MVDAAGLSDYFNDGPTKTTSEPTEPQIADPTKLTPEEKEAFKQYPLIKTHMEIRASNYQVGNCISNTRVTILKDEGGENSKRDVEQSKSKV